MLIAWIAVAVGSLAQTTAGFGFALVCAPALVTVLGPSTGVRTVLTLSCLISLLILARGWRYSRWRDAVLLALPGVLLAAPIALAVHQLDHRVLTIAAGMVTLAAAGLMYRQRRSLPLHGAVGAGVVGIVSAIMNALGGLSGPAAALYAADQRWSPQSIPPTLQVFGLVLNTASLATLGGPALDLRLASALPLGWVCGLLAASRLPTRHVRHVILAVAAVGGVLAVARGL